MKREISAPHRKEKRGEEGNEMELGETETVLEMGTGSWGEGVHWNLEPLLRAAVRPFSKCASRVFDGCAFQQPTRNRE